jgi:hypothetical protein
MKKILFISISASLVLFSSCRKRYDNDPSALMNYKIETAFDEMTNISDQAVTGNMVYYKSGEVVYTKPGATTNLPKTPCNVIITLDTTTFPRTVTVDYGNTNCDCNDGKVRRGKIITTYTGPYLAPGTVITHTPESYYVNDVLISGTKTVQNMGQNASSQPYFQVEINGSATNSDGEVLNYTSSRVRTFNTLLDRFDDEYDITGSASGTFSSGGGYTSQTITPIRIKVGCGFPVSGELQITPIDRPVRTINYGDGSCDYSFTVTVNGYTFTIN